MNQLAKQVQRDVLSGAVEILSKSYLDSTIRYAAFMRRMGIDEDNQSKNEVRLVRELRGKQ